MVATRSSSKESAPAAKLKTTLLSGFLGSGKTTLLQHILRNKQGLKCAVIVNDMAALNIDSSLVKNSKLIQREERLVEMQNGCICCTLREDLLQEVAELAAAGRWDYLLIESTGIGEPQQVAETFELAPTEGGPPLRQLATLDTCVTVLDAATLLANALSVETVADREGEDAAGGERNISDLLLDQIEFANVILLNKCDLVADEERDSLVALLRRLNPGARVIPTRHSEVDLGQVLNTGLFDFEAAAEMPGWLQSLRDGHTPETEEYGISSWIYKARRPFHPRRLWELLSANWVVQQVESAGDAEEEEEEEGSEAGAEEQGSGTTIHGEELSAEAAAERAAALKARFGGVLRSKGYLWLGGRDDMAGEWSQAGSILRISCAGPWFAAMPEEFWDADPAKVKADFEGEAGDRRQELVFIGQGMKREALTAALDACLCTEEEMAQELELTLDLAASPFLQWPAMEIAEVTDDEAEDSEADDGREEEEEEEEEAGKEAASPTKKARRT